MDENRFYKQVSELLENARKQARTAVNLSMVYAYFETDRLIMESEQNGEMRKSS